MEKDEEQRSRRARETRECMRLPRLSVGRTRDTGRHWKVNGDTTRLEATPRGCVMCDLLGNLGKLSYRALKRSD